MLSEEWVEVGFQGEDPSTDFRGTGRLGYNNLIYLVKEYPEKAEKLLAIARRKETEYFFACAGINVTFFLKKMIPEDQQFAEFLGKARTIEGVERRFNEMYCMVFEEFIKFWNTHPENSSFMNFNKVLVSNNRKHQFFESEFSMKTQLNNIRNNVHQLGQKLKKD